jgi:tRNA 2-thiouridine synthesizing protein B
MTTLHTVNKSPFEKNSLASCLRLAEPGSALLLIEDGVYGAQRGTRHSGAVECAAKTLSLYVLGPDVRARGLDPDGLIEGVSIVDYDGFVDLASTHARVHAWL